MTMLSLRKLVLYGAVVSLVLTVGVWQLQAQTNKTQAKFDEAIAAYEAGDYVTAFTIWLPLAYENDPAAQRNLGHLYRMGLGVKQDFSKAADWYRRAAELGLHRAQANLANMYLRGQGVEKDSNAAARWFTAAAKQGHTISQYNLGLIYEHGLGVGSDDAEAIKWYYLASKSGHAKALSKLALLISKNATPKLADLITGEDSETAVVAKFAPSVPAETKTSAASIVAVNAARPSGATSTEEAENGSPHAHSRALAYVSTNTNRTQLPIPQLPSIASDSSRVGPAADSAGRNDSSSDQDSGLLDTLRLLIEPTQTYPGDRENAARSDLH